MSGVVGFEYDCSDDESYHSDDGEGGQCSLCEESNPKRYYKITKMLPTRRRYCPNFKNNYIETSQLPRCYMTAEEEPEGWAEFKCECGGQIREEEFVITICKSCYNKKYFL